MNSTVITNPKDFFPDDEYDDGNIPPEDYPESVEPLPEYTRPRKDGPGGD
ncbi:MAG: AE-binding protein [Acetatifactor sp.]|jgi:hypothetical protein|nr:AE-binding protein [Acetatifactor sp.]